MSQTLENPKVSVVIPVKNSAKTIGNCLAALYLNNNVDFETLVVDDGCTDNTIDIVSKYKCSVLKNNVYSGVSGARNAGAFVANGDVLVFIDSDIVVSKDALLRISERIQSTDAVVGILSKNIRYNNFSSQHKNLWMNYTFNKLADNISLIFSSVAAIKRDIFLKHGGFDVNYMSPNVEDNELGIRLRDAGYSIILDKDLQVEHLKKYTFLSLLKTHYSRTKGLIKLYHRKKLIGLSKKNPSSVPNNYLFNIPLTIALICLLFSFSLRGHISSKIAIAVFLSTLFVFINFNWLHFLNKNRGVFFALKSLLYLPLEFIVIIFGLAIGQIEYLTGKRY